MKERLFMNPNHDPFSSSMFMFRSNSVDMDTQERQYTEDNGQAHSLKNSMLSAKPLVQFFTVQIAVVSLLLYFFFILSV